MDDQQRIAGQIAEIRALMLEKLGAGGPSLAAALRKAGRRLPRRLRAPAQRLAAAEPLAAHPKLSRTLDAPALTVSRAELRAWLKAVDPADRRKGWWLGMLGGMAFNILFFAALLIVVLRWRGYF